MKFSDLKECPFCGNDEFYVSLRVFGTTRHNSRFDGGIAWNGEMYETMNTRHGVRAYCNDCEAYLGNTETDELSKAAMAKMKGD